MIPDALKTIQQIEDAIRSSQPIPASLVEAWMSSRSLDVQGALTDLLLDHSRQIVPPLSFERIFDTCKNYYRECLIQNVQDSDYAPNRSIAGVEIVRWFRYLWRDSTVPREYLVRLKSMLRDLCIENKVSEDQMVGLIEHLFESLEIQEFFADWKSDPRLSEAFALAKEWGDRHLNNPSF